MIINVTEEQKQLIESQGYMVVQFKKWCIDVMPIMERFFDRVLTDIQKLIAFFEHMALKIREALQPVFDFAEQLNKELEFIPDEYVQEYAVRRAVVFVKNLGRKYEPNICNKVIYHRCRDRC